jgi:uncharacterized membrane protein YidH (DUF202 family)
MNHTKKLEILKGLRKLCQGAVVFGFVTSAGGNILHAVEAYAGRPVAILSIAVVLAALIPAIFGWMFEIASRVFFRREAHIVMKLIAFTGAAGISGITAWNSYFHQRDAFSHFGDATQAKLLPFAIDGLMIIGSVYLLELGFQIRDLEAWIEAGGNVRKIKEEAPPPVKKDREPTKKEKIIQILARAPELDAKAVAAATGATYNYAYSVMQDLKQRATDLVEVEEPQLA